MTGLETAIILVAFVITAAAFAFVVLNMGFLTAQKSQTVISAGMEEATSSMICDGEVVAKFDTTTKTLQQLTFYVKLSAGKSPIDLSDQKLVITYSNPREQGVIYSQGVANSTALKPSVVTITQVQGNGNALLENGETFKIYIDFTQAALNANTTLTAPGLYTTQYEAFTVTVRPIVGSVLTIERNVPAIENIYQVLD